MWFHRLLVAISTIHLVTPSQLSQYILKTVNRVVPVCMWMKLAKPGHYSYSPVSLDNS